AFSASLEKSVQTIIVFIVPELILQNYKTKPFYGIKKMVTLHKMMMKCLFKVMNRYLPVEVSYFTFQVPFWRSRLKWKIFL
uniref:hypothetical protein n=1 Tax=Chryseobacterium sp. TaxID=1871047 RepID=UPI0024E1F10E